MPVIDEIIRAEKNGAVSFGDYVSKVKRKVSEFEQNGEIYNVKTHNAITRLEKNNKLLLETVPGSVVHGFLLNEASVSFTVEGTGDTQVTLELAPETEYRIFVDDMNVGSMKSNLAGKINFSVELSSGARKVKIEKAG